MDKEGLRRLAKFYRQKIKSVPEISKSFWKHKLEDVKKKLYGERKP